jgi:hypothetical protein
MENNQKNQFETSNIDLATFLKYSKKKVNSGHRYDDRGRLLIIFDDIDEDKVDLYLHQYLNSEWSNWDNVKKSFLSLIRNKNNK